MGPQSKIELALIYLISISAIRLYAPEILKNEGYSFSVDYYNVGTLTYELVLNRRPFRNKKDQRELYNEILTKEIELPQHLSPELRDFLRQLLHKDPQNRLGKNGIEEIMSHPWLKGGKSTAAMKISVENLEKIVRPCDPDIDKDVNIDRFSSKMYDENYIIQDKHINRFSIYSEQGSNPCNIISISSVSNYDPDETLSQDAESIFRKFGSITDIIPDEITEGSSPVNKAIDSPLIKVKSSINNAKRSNKCEEFPSCKTVQNNGPGGLD